MFIQFATVNSVGHVVSESKKYGPVRTVRIRENAILVNGSVFATKFDNKWKLIESHSWNMNYHRAGLRMVFRDGDILWDDVFVTSD